MTADVFVYDALRTPFGSYGGALAGVRPDDLAAHIVLADSALQEHRGSPLLLDLAHHVCGAVFGGALQTLTEAAYASAGEPWRYFSERTTRDN